MVLAEAHLAAAALGPTRVQFIELHFGPLAARVFVQAPEVRSLVLAVAQYWCDEADDAVHFEVVPCGDEDPRWPDCASDPRFFTVEEDGYVFPHDRTDALTGYEATEDLPTLDENSTAITAFGAFCLEASDQEMDLAEAYLPYAIARRGPGGEVVVEVVGKVIQPHWEDRFDVGFHSKGSLGGLSIAPQDGGLALADDEAEPSDRSEPPRGLGGWLRRILGEDKS